VDSDEKSVNSDSPNLTTNTYTHSEERMSFFTLHYITK
jgi:hypothetical protein